MTLAAIPPHRSAPVAQPLPLGHSSRGQAKGHDRNSHTRHCASAGRAGETDMNLLNSLRSFARNDEGQDLLEYALLIALIALVAIGAVTAAGTKVNEVFSAVATGINVP